MVSGFKSLAPWILLVLTACAPVATPVAIPQAAYVGTTPAYAAWLEDWVQAYWEQQPGNGVTPLVYPLQAAWKAVEQAQVELVISAAAPPAGWFATPLQHDAIAVLVHPGLKIGSLDLNQLYDIFTGRVENWNELEGEDQVIQPIIPLAGDETRTLFQAQVLQDANFTSNALIAPNPGAALELLDSTPGAIAWMPWTAVPEGRSLLSIEGVRLSKTTLESGRYPLTLDLFAVAPDEPSGSMRQFLGWLQAALQPSP